MGITTFGYTGGAANDTYHLAQKIATAMGGTATTNSGSTYPQQNDVCFTNSLGKISPLFLRITKETKDKASVINVGSSTNNYLDVTQIGGVYTSLVNFCVFTNKAKTVRAIGIYSGSNLQFSIIFAEDENNELVSLFQYSNQYRVRGENFASAEPLTVSNSVSGNAELRQPLLKLPISGAELCLRICFLFFLPRITVPMHRSLSVERSIGCLGLLFPDFVVKSNN